MWMYNYNHLNLLLVLLIVFLEIRNEENNLHSYGMSSIIAVLYGVLPLVKQSTGGVIYMLFNMECYLLA